MFWDGIDIITGRTLRNCCGSERARLIDYTPSAGDDVVRLCKAGRQSLFCSPFHYYKNGLNAKSSCDDA